MRRNLPLVLVVVVLALTAGCQSLNWPPGEDTSTPSQFEKHEEALRQAGSATVNYSYRSTSFESGNSSSTNKTDTTRIEFSTGRALQNHEPLRGDDRTRYRDEDGDTYTKMDDTTVYLSPSQSEPLDINGTISPFPVTESGLENEGDGTVDGFDGTVYVAASVEDLRDDQTQSLNTENVRSFRATFVVDDDGYVSYQRLNYTVVRDGVTYDIEETIRITDVGSTTVEPPEWLDRVQ